MFNSNSGYSLADIAAATGNKETTLDGAEMAPGGLSSYSCSVSPDGVEEDLETLVVQVPH